MQAENLNRDIKTQRCLLRKYDKKDREPFAELSVDKEVNFFMGGKCETKDEAYEVFDKVFKIYGGALLPRHFEIWAIEIEGEYAGHFELKQTSNTAENELEVVYFLDKRYWGMGLMPEIINEMNVYAGTMSKQLIATASSENSKTMRALAKAGIQKQEYIEDEDGLSLKIWIEPFAVTEKKI